MEMEINLFVLQYSCKVLDILCFEFLFIKGKSSLVAMLTFFMLIPFFFRLCLFLEGESVTLNLANILNAGLSHSDT